LIPRFELAHNRVCSWRDEIIPKLSPFLAALAASLIATCCADKAAAAFTLAGPIAPKRR
jgi:hypothetical protein